MNVTFVLTDKCNLSCCYCFELNCHDNALREKFKVITAEQIINTLGDLNDGTGVDFYGGEPCLELDIISDTIKWATNNNRRFSFTLNTNGQCELNKDFVDNCLSHVEQIVISIDGPAYVNDKNRGEGTLDKILTFIEALDGYGYKSFFLRSTFTKDNIPYLQKTAEWFYDLQKQYNISNHLFKFNMADFADWSESDFILFEEVMTEVLDWYETLPEQSKKIFRMVGLENAIAKKNNSVERYFSVCTAGISSFSFSPSFDIYPCVTEVFFDKTKRHKPLKSFADSNEYRKLTMVNHFKACFDCEMYECGPCPALFRIETGEYTGIPDNYCRLGKLKNRILLQHIEKHQLGRTT